MITFPTTTEAFAAYQEAGAGRKLNDFEKELMRRSVEVLNDCYEGGRAGKRIPFPGERGGRASDSFRHGKGRSLGAAIYEEIYSLYVVLDKNGL